MGIVFLWVSSGTLFYSYCNDWPIPQSFFYAVDAGMSIGFCTDVAEKKLVSKAFTIVYILLGASVVGGALALFIQDAVEGIRDNKPKTKGYQLLLEKDTFEKFNESRSGVLNFDEFKQLLHSATNIPLSDEDVQILWTTFDRFKDNVIHFEEFTGTYQGIDELIASLHKESHKSTNLLPKILSKLKTWWNNENRIYFVFLAWILLGVTWGMYDQGWDPITATHFAVSALATGGLTAPPVNSDGILPAPVAIFCGLYCLFGIPLMAVALGHFAYALVSKHVAEIEEWSLTRPMTGVEFEFAKEHLTERASQKSQRGLHLSDFVVLQLLRQGKLSIESFEVLKKDFDMLDKDQTGILTLEEATNWNSTSSSKK
jgi:Ca2+-binding EF-hand superfamily protein